MKLLIVILAYNAERHIEGVFENIPPSYINSDDTQILLIDDASQDRTVEVAHAYIARTGLTNARVFKNVVNQGYGGNQKVGYTYAIREGFDVVAMLRGDNEYSARALPELFSPFRENSGVGCVLGVRFGKHHPALRGGMPAYRYVGSWILTALQNRLAGVQFGDWHTGYRAYSTRALSRIGFALNTNDLHFDTEILLQLIDDEARFVEVNIPTQYRDEISHVNRLRYAKNVIKASTKFWLQKVHLFYDVRFHPEVLFNRPTDASVHPVYEAKLELRTPHSIVCRDPGLVYEGANVLDVGCSTGYVAAELVRQRRCRVTGVDMLPPSKVSSNMRRYEQIDLEVEEERLIDLVREGNFDVILMLDILEHLAAPERFLLKLSSLPYGRVPRFVCSTANVAFVVVRVMLLLGHFNYGQRGILDVTHKRLFSVHTFRNLLEQTGFLVQREIFIPFPFRSLGISARWAAFLERVNMLLIKVRPRLFAYQIMFEARPLTTPAATLDETIKAASHAALP
jgi:2-polyprenyl-3-methyl-5-hydroxy-6-metoxy-1,4-benzoquinol methylase